MAIQNIKVLRPGKSEVSTAIEYGYGEVHVRKGPDAIDSTIVLSMEEAQQLSEDLVDQVRMLNVQYAAASRHA